MRACAMLDRLPERAGARAGRECTDCAQPIYSGEEVVDIDGDLYHLECIERMSTTELLALMGYRVYEV